MFTNTINTAKRLTRVPISLAIDEHGFLDRVCPSDQCAEAFKVHLDDWKEKVRDEQVFCPVCRHEAKATEWNTPQQEEHIRSAAEAHIRKQLSRALAADARAFNARQRRNSFVKMSMTHRPSALRPVVPVAAADTMELRVSCEACACRYASIGAAFFCPACGHNSARTTFAQMVATVCKTINLLPTIVSTVRESGGADAARDVERSLLEANLGRLVSSFQRLAEATFNTLPNAVDFPPRRNLFQNLTDSSEHWFRATGRRYEDMLLPEELSDLQRLFQQRHLLTHCEGMIDQRYLDHTGDRTYGLGQRLVIKATALVRLAAIVTRLGEALQTVAPARAAGGGTP